MKHAVISPDGKYRYKLGRSWGGNGDTYGVEFGTVLWIMLNPSTADATVDDPTIKRCIQFSNREGHNRMLVGNLYAYRATDPSRLWSLGAEEARGPDNRKSLWEMSLQAARIIYAWGASGPMDLPINLVVVTPPLGIWCLGRTKSNSPKHPLYVRGDTPLVRVA